MQLFTQSRFNGGISEDDRIANPDQYLYGENIDVFSEPEFIQLSDGFQDSMTATENIYQMLKVTNRVTNVSQVIGFSEDLIYHADSSTPVYSSSHLNKLEWGTFVLGDYVYWVVNNGPSSAFTLDRTTITDAISSTWSPTVSYLTLTTNNYFKHASVLIRSDVAIVTLGNVIHLIDPTAGVSDEYVITQDEIAGVTGAFGNFFVFTTTGKLIIWDGSSTEIDYSIDIGIKPKKIYQYGTAVYALTNETGSDKGIYQFDGQKFVPLARQKYSRLAVKWKNRFRTDIGSIAGDKDNMYLVNDTRDDEAVVFFGAEVSGTQKGFHQINVGVTGITDVNIESMFHDGSKLYVGYTGDGQHGIKTNDGNKNTSGYIITNIQDYDNPLVVKTSEGFYFKCQDVDANHTIKFSISVDGGSFTDVITYTSQPLKGIARVENRLLESVGVPIEYDEYAIKFTLTSNDGNSPKIYNGYGHKWDYSNVM